MNDGKELRGTVTYNLDYKGRICIRNFRPIIGEKVVLLDSREGDCIDVYTEKDFEAKMERANALKKEMGAKFVRDLIRYISTKFIDSKEIDKQYRLQIPKKAIDKYNLSGETVIVGKVKKLSIYNKEAYKNYKKSLFE